MKDATAAIETLRALEREHRALDDELRVLSRRAYLTPGEQRAASELKRRKLSAKDRIEALRRSAS